jgi:hypothetical protein
MGKGAGKGGDGAKAKVEKPKWIKVHGKFYDVSEFKHPGGNIVEVRDRSTQRRS